VGRLRAAGHRVVFITNNASVATSAVEERLEAMGIPAVGDVITSADVGASLVGRGERVLVLGTSALVAAVARRGASVVSLPPDLVDDVPPEPAELDPACDAVITGWTRTLRWVDLAAAHVAIAGGARFIATNRDVEFPAGSGTLPGNGAAVAAIATSTGVEPTVAGKPHQPMADVLRQRAGEHGTLVGDQPLTDWLLAQRAGWDFGLVLSGITSDPAKAIEAGVEPTHVAPDLARLVDQALR
jgi:HAD superfamily hydrolase (TIGR01450 family)